MAGGALTAPDDAGRLRRRWLALPLALRVGIVYLAARALTFAILLIAAGLSGPDSPFGMDAALGDFVVGWDARWYWIISGQGYPAELPLTDSGEVAQNAWAFMPVFPYLALAVGTPFGSWAIGAAIVSLAAGYGACLVLCLLLREHLDESAAQWATAFFAAGPLAALFHVGYAETLFLLMLFLALWAVERRRYAWLYPLIPLMGFTRPGVLAFALFLGLHGILRWLRRREESLSARQIMHIVALGTLATIVGFAWTWLATAVTGHPDAYLETELAWRRLWLTDPDASFVPLAGFLQGAAFWGRWWGIGEPLAYILLAASVVGVALLLWREPHVRRLGPELRLWAASYLVYLLLVFFPQSSTLRLLLPLAPVAAGALAVPRHRVWRIAILCVCVIGQVWWTFEMYAQPKAFWRIP